jgi:hypothetical protein
MPSERDDDGIDALICARSGAPALILKPSAAYPREDAARSDLFASATVLLGTIGVASPLFVLACDA